MLQSLRDFRIRGREQVLLLYNLQLTLEFRELFRQHSQEEYRLNLYSQLLSRKLLNRYQHLLKIYIAYLKNQLLTRKKG